jgi:hypothetical protein
MNFDNAIDQIYSSDGLRLQRTSIPRRVSLIIKLDISFRGIRTGTRESSYQSIS